MLAKALKWFAIEWLKAFAFCASIALFLGFLMTLIAFPVQTIATLVIGSFVVIMFFAIYETR